MRKLIYAALAALTLAAPLLASPAPALAATDDGCPDDYVCLYQNVNYGAGRWQSTLNNIENFHTNRCLTLTTETWSNGTPVRANSSGWVINPIGSVWTNHILASYSASNCAPSSMISTPVNLTPGWPVEVPWFGEGAYHAIASMTVTCKGFVQNC